MSRWPLTVRGTGALLLAVVCFVAAHALNVTELLYVSVLLVVAVAASLATLYVVRRTETVTRAFVPDVATAGGQVRVRLRVGIRSPLPGAQGRWADRLPAGVAGDASGIFPETESTVRGGANAITLEYEVTAHRRGIRTFGPLEVTSTDPFGFARRRHAVGQVLGLTVAPATVELSPLADQPGEAGGSMHSAADQPGQGADNLVPRHYIPGDSMRRIHWRASAHRDQLMVRQEEQETTPEALVVLDRAASHWDADAARAPGTDPGFEAAVTACASTAALLVREGYRVSVLDADGTPLAEPIDGGDLVAVEALTVDLATVTAHRDGGPAALLALLAGTMTGPLIYVCGAITPADADVIAPLAHRSALPVMLAVAPRGEALGHAEASGWRAASIPPGTDLAQTWHGLVERGALRAGA